MKMVIFSTFVFKLDEDLRVLVQFDYDTRGKPVRCNVYHGDELKLSIGNCKHEYKPCVTHALELVDRTIQKKPRSEFAKGRHGKPRRARPVPGGTRKRSANHSLKLCKPEARESE